MISLVSLMWTTAGFFALFGALRGWHRELIGTTGVVLGFFAIFQFDSLLRGSLYSLLTKEMTFLLQMALFLGIITFAYRSQLTLVPGVRSKQIRDTLLGAAVGFFNGYVIAGSIWYFLDINRYPFALLVSAPAETSASFQSLGLMPIVLLGGGLAGSGALLALAVLAILAIVILII